MRPSHFAAGVDPIRERGRIQGDPRRSIRSGAPQLGRATVSTLHSQEHPMRPISLAAVALASAVLLSGFSRSAPAAPAALNDAAIAGILVAADSWDSTTGTLASHKATRADVRAYGATLARDHAGVNQQAVALAKKLGVTPTPVPADFPLKLDFEATMKTLNKLSGPAFDSAFLAHEVAYHKAVIEAVTTQFLPAIQNAELKSFVQSIAPAFQAHLALAENLQKQM